MMKVCDFGESRIILLENGEREVVNEGGLPVPRECPVGFRSCASLHIKPFEQPRVAGAVICELRCNHDPAPFGLVTLFKTSFASLSFIGNKSGDEFDVHPDKFALTVDKPKGEELVCPERLKNRRPTFGW